MLDRNRVNDLTVKANTLVTDITGIRETLTAQTTLLETISDRLAALENPKVQPLPYFIDLTESAPRINTDATLHLIRGWISVAGAVELILRVGEMGVFQHLWLPPNGVIHQLPLLPEAPLMVPRGTAIWIETIGVAQPFHCKLVGFRG